ncbi:hypothetical protein HDU67_004815, partial [Dinochytrium kinnereticum]
FEAYGCPIPRFVNPGDHAIDLVNTDFDIPPLSVTKTAVTHAVPTTTDTLSTFYRSHVEKSGLERSVREFVGEGTEEMGAGRSG